MTLIKSLLEDYLFNESVYGEMKSNGKFKFLHIGLSLWEMLATEAGKWDFKGKYREAVVEELIGENFVQVLVKNVSNAKA